jgi:hypothetical protein
MKLQAAVDKLFSHKMFSNKYFLYALVAASILTNYMRIVESHYEVVGFFILVGIIMMNFSKNIAVVLTVCLLLTQIIMAGKAVREGLENMPDTDPKKYMTPEELRDFEKKRENLKNINEKIDARNVQLSDVNKNIAKATSKINAAKAAIAAYDASEKSKSKNSKMERQIAKENNAKNTADLAVAERELAKYTREKVDIESKIEDLTKKRVFVRKEIEDLKAAAKAKAKAAPKASTATPAASTARPTPAASTPAASTARPAPAASTASVATPAASTARPAPAAAPPAASTARPAPAASTARPTTRAAAKSAIELNALKRRQRARKQPFSLLSENDNDMDDVNAFDFIGPSDIPGLTQGTTNLMTKQKDLFTVMNSMTPLIENAKKMLDGLDLSKLRA